MNEKRDEEYWINNDAHMARYNDLVDKGYHMLKDNPKSLWDLGVVREYTKMVIREERKRASKQLLKLIRDWVNK